MTEARGEAKGEAEGEARRGPLGIIDGYWMAPAPAERLAFVRIAVGLYALIYLAGRVPHWLSYAHFNPHQYQPVGLLAWLQPKPFVPAVVYAMVFVTVACAVPFVLGWRHRVFGPLFGFLVLWTLSYANSWGMVFHTENLVVMHVLVLGITRSADAWSMDARRQGPAPESGRYGWPLKLLCFIVVIAYVLAGVAKMRNAGMDWLWGDELRNHIAMDNARKALLGDIYSPLATPLLQLGDLFRVLAFITVMAELAAPVALIGPRVAGVWVAVVMGFHWGVVALMMITFPYQMLGVAFLPFFPVEHLGRRLAARWHRRRRRGPEHESATESEHEHDREHERGRDHATTAPAG
jgi:hypothetical protein